MIWLNPDQVTLGSNALTGVLFIAVDRAAAKLVVERTDLGPYAAFADAPEQRITIRISREVRADESTPVRPGDLAALSFRTAPNASAAGGRAVAATVVIVSIEHTISPRGGARQTIEAIPISADGAADPIAETASPGAF